METYIRLAKLVSEQRMQRYLYAANGGKNKAVELYWLNLHLSGELFKLIAFFEVVLRNQIDSMGKKLFGNQSKDWLTGAVAHGLLENKYPIKDLLEDGQYGSQLVANLPFGFWCSLFSGRQFMSVGSKLLRVFAENNKPVRPSPIRRQLHLIRVVRNRIAHHEPIIFDHSGSLSCLQAEGAVEAISDLLGEMQISTEIIKPLTCQMDKLMGPLKQKPSGVKQ